MDVSKTPIPLDDEESIKRFTEAIHRRPVPLPSRAIPPSASSYNTSNENDDLNLPKNQSTQTDPVTITINLYPNGQQPPNLRGFAADNVTLGHTKPKNPAIESLISQSPQVSGVLAPPSTPETIPNHEISQMIADAIDDLPPGSFSSLGDSRFAPRRSPSLRTSSANKTSVTSKDHLYSNLNQQLSPVDRKAKEESFTRMSFQAADTHPTLVDDKLAESAFLKDVQSSKWADKPPKRTPPAPTNTGTTQARANPFSVLSHGPDKKLDSAAMLGNERLNFDVTEKPTAANPNVKSTVTKDTTLPPHLRPVAKSWRAPGSTDAEFAQLTDRLELSDSTHERDDPKISNKEPSKQKVSPNPEASVFSPWSSDSENHPTTYRSGPRAVEPTNVPKEIDLLSSDCPMKPAFEIENSTGRPVSPKTQAMSVLTPTSIEFKSASPPKVASGLANDENLDGALFFKAWPKVEERNKPAAQIRKVMITGVPSPNPRLIASLVFGGALDHFYTRETSAVVVFLRAEDARKFYDATPNGVVYMRDGKKCTAFVEIGEDIDVVGGQLATYIEKGFTRCIRVIGAAPDISLTQLWAKAEDKNRRVESIEDGKSAAGLRSIIFRFCDIRYAVTFKFSLEREEQWDHCNIHFFTDPCETATGPHF